MEVRSPLHQQVDTLPDLLRQMVDPLVPQAAETLPPATCAELQQVFLCGCGDSHHAGINAELAFSQLAGLPCRAATAMHFGRYLTPFLPDSSLVLGVSVSGMVSRTIEALDLARQAGAVTVAVTGNRKKGLAEAAEKLLYTAVPPLPDELKGLVIPGARSYIASQLTLYLTAIHIGQERGHLRQKEANALRRELAAAADLMEATIAANDPTAREAVSAWEDAAAFVFCGSGPNYGTALFSAAKILEASGDMALAQDMEEWAHLEYFAREPATPTLLISAGDRDQDRVQEIATAAKAIGRRLAVVAPENSPLAESGDKDFFFPLHGPIRECFSPLLACIPGLLFAAYRAQQTGEVYFRGFGGGRSPEGGGGISRIRSSQRRQSL
jgi:glutamine---fructose-6-phosphate transaminase (isomerizing)